MPNKIFAQKHSFVLNNVTKKKLSDACNLPCLQKEYENLYQKFQYHCVDFWVVLAEKVCKIPKIDKVLENDNPAQSHFLHDEFWSFVLTNKCKSPANLLRMMAYVGKILFHHICKGVQNGLPEACSKPVAEP